METLAVVISVPFVKLNSRPRKYFYLKGRGEGCMKVLGSTFSRNVFYMQIHCFSDVCHNKVHFSPHPFPPDRTTEAVSVKYNQKGHDHELL